MNTRSMPRAAPRAPLGRLLAFLLPLAWPMALSAALRVAAQGAGIALLCLAAAGLGRVAEGSGPGGSETIWAMAGGLALLGALKAVTRYAEQVSGHGVAFRILAAMRAKAFESLERLAPAYPESDRSGELVARLIGDVDRIEVFYAHAVGPFVAALALGAGSCAAAYAIGGPRAGPLAALVLGAAFLLAGFLLPYAAYRLSAVHGARARTARAAMRASAAESLRGAEELYALGAAGRKADELDRLGSELAAAQRALAMLSGLKDAAVDLVISAAVLLFAFLAAGAGLGAPAAFALVALAAGAFAPALALGRTFDDLPETIAAAGRYFALLDKEPAVSFVEATSNALGSGGDSRGLEGTSPRGLALSFRDVRFSYDGSPFALGPVSLELPAGTHCVVSGPSGGGKSTLARLAARFHDPRSGAVFVGGRRLDELSEAELRASVAYIGQDAFLFDATVRDALILAAPKASDGELAAALDSIGFLSGQAGRLDRRVGARGSALSGGERKRLAAARAIVGGAPVVVLDEAFSNLDAATRSRARAAVLGALRGRTVLEISHEPEDALEADTAATMREGRLSRATPSATRSVC